MSKQAIPDATRVNAFLVDPHGLTIIGHDTKDGIEHPLFDPRVALPLDEGLVVDIMEIGQIQEVIVRKNGGNFEVVAGRQRVRAISEINKRRPNDPMKVRVSVRKPVHARSVDADALGVTISENENRVNDDYVAKAAKAQRLIGYGLTNAEVARRFGVSEQSLGNLLKISDLSDAVRGAIQAQKIGFIAAIQLCDLDHAAQDEALASVIENGASTAELQRQRKLRKKGKSNGNNGVTEETEGLRGKRQPTKMLRKISEHEGFAELSPDARAMLLFILGDESQARRIKGLTALLKE